MSQNDIIAKQLSKLRRDKGASQQEIATELHVSRATIANYETGKRAPDYETLIKLAEYYHVSCDYILREVDSDFAEIHSTTGLNDEAIEQLWEEYQGGWRGDDYRANDIMNEFIRRGLLGCLVGEMAEYADNLEQHVKNLSEVYQNALQQYEHFITDDSEFIISDDDSIQVFVSDEFQLLHLNAIEDTSEQKKNMRLSLFEMSEIPKAFITKYFDDLNRQYDDLIEKIKDLNTKVTKMRIEKTYQALEHLGKEGDPHSKDQETK